MLSAFSFHGGSKMKVLAVFLAIVIFVTLSACGTEEVEVTRAVEVTRIV
jgi:hypothetical protein